MGDFHWQPTVGLWLQELLVVCGESGGRCGDGPSSSVQVIAGEHVDWYLPWLPQVRWFC